MTYAIIAIVGIIAVITAMAIWAANLLDAIDRMPYADD